MIGELWAKKELIELNETFGWFEWLIHTGTVFFFGCTGVLMIPFVQVYTKGITDANYIQPLFAVLITVANAGHCLRLPYNIMILVGGHYKQTQSNYITAAIVNIVISVVAVKQWGLIGVAIGTLVAMLYQTIWMAIYDNKNLIRWPIKKFVKQCSVDLITAVVAAVISIQFHLIQEEYFYWFILALETAIVWIVVILVVNRIFYKEKIEKIFEKLRLKKQREVN